MRRMSVFSHLLEEKLHRGQMRVDFMFRGGAKLDWVLHNIDEAEGYDILVVMAGGNDLSSGATKHYFDRHYQWLEEQAWRLRLKSVIITSIWPRGDRQYNRMALAHNTYMVHKYFPNPFVTFWEWDLRQPFRTVDGVHLEQKGYKKSMTYLLAPINWVVNHCPAFDSD